jgi:hypothetical protein
MQLTLTINYTIDTRAAEMKGVTSPLPYSVKSVRSDEKHVGPPLNARCVKDIQ